MNRPPYGLGCMRLAQGWLPAAAAASAMGITVRELERLARDRIIRSMMLGPKARLYEVRRSDE